MANIINNEGELFRKTAADTARKFSSVQNGKGSRWRTLPTDNYKKNFDAIDWHRSLADTEKEKDEHRK